MRAKFLGNLVRDAEAGSKKAVCRLINQVYISRAAEFKEFGDEITISMIEWLYDFIFNKYGFAKVAEKKFYEVLAACS